MPESLRLVRSSAARGSPRCDLTPAREQEIADELVTASRRSLRAAARRGPRRPRRQASRARGARRSRHARPRNARASSGPDAAADSARLAKARRDRGRSPGSALRGTHAAAAAGLHDRRRADPRAGDWRQHRGVQPRQCHAAAAASRRRPRTPRLRVPGRGRQRVLVSAVRRAARQQPVVRRIGGMGRHHGEPARRRLSRAGQRRHRHRQLLRRAGRARGARTSALAARR